MTNAGIVASAERLDEYSRNGFVVIPGMLPADEVSVLRDSLQRCVDEDLARWGENYADRWMVHNLMLRGREFERILENPTMHAYLSAILDDKCIVYAYTSSSMPPNGSNYSRRVHVDCPRFIPGYTTNVGVVFALDDFLPENGATYFLPGSYQSPERPTEAEFSDRAVQALPRAGDGIIFNARTWHSGGTNTTSRARHALTINVCRSYMRQRFDYPRMTPADTFGRLGAVGRRFLGFNVRMPASLDEYYLPESERLYKAGQG